MYVPALHTIQATPLLFAILPFAQDVQFLLPAKTATFPLKHLAHGIVGEAEKNPGLHSLQDERPTRNEPALHSLQYCCPSSSWY